MFKPRKGLLLFLSFLILTGFIVSAILLWQHYRTTYLDFQGQSFCSINEWVDCDVVTASPYSKIGLIPIAFLDILFFVFIGFHLIRALVKSNTSAASMSLCCYLSFFGVLASLLMAYFSFFKVGALCILCVALYVIHFLLFIFFPKVIDQNITFLFSFKFPPRFWLHFISWVLFLGLGLFVFQTLAHEALLKKIQRQKAQEQKKISANAEHVLTLEEAVKIHFNSPPTPINVGDAPFEGNPRAPIQVVTFSDFQCPFCQVAATELKEMLKPYGDKVVFYYISYPLDQSCNPYLHFAMHPFACMAAKVAMCAQSKNKFWTMHNLLFENQKSLSANKIKELAQKSGLTSNEINQCLDSMELDKKIKNIIELGKTLGVSGTPTVFVNGRKLSTWRHPLFFQAVLAQELNPKE
ncbi:MAG: hypothetical protein A3G32_09535 [Deltaproteobacteria bacterium RIFCSPLOWO2_12_FULL_40_28]|nr:MAG: hypothetical protein A3C45_07805 [Deltaproteobacteria bacterium RIFCSPHIGHO2_02_FULL_40_28]OGQ20522.1 MAG: hypothetical protein A3E27_02595 [Deltaproteobacteria bacterium RIFCSPHIGHO2_12_FULL_40_32]OGQ41173.1 MAG: hypothetical protein A3I69_07830 [Deltaproteobacteria bacterium RIFCSPLOWO2_02_FULL_40_36]OGQ55135.1 MAG: hypothetical protein A3G32_09535 [Deltaproteobacteria bacterium RIFCSPLOWO2_12_FULL_40_28]